MKKAKRNREVTVPMSTKNPKALARIDPDVLNALSVLAKAMNIPQYQALEDAAMAWCEQHRDECTLRLPGAPPPNAHVIEKRRKDRRSHKSQSQE